MDAASGNTDAALDWGKSEYVSFSVPFNAPLKYSCCV